MKKKCYLFTAAVLSAALLLGACSGTTSTNGKEEKKIRIAWWGSQNRHNITQQVIDLYAQKNSGITFEPEIIGADVQHYEKMATQAAANNLPDIFQIVPGSAVASSFVKKGQLMQLDDFVSKGILDTKEIPQSVVDFGKFDGGLYSVPLGIGTTCIIVNKDIFDAAGIAVPDESWEWDDFFALCKEIHDKTGKYAIYGYSATWLMEIDYAGAIGKSFYNNEGTQLGFAKEDFEKLLTKQVEMIDAKIIPSMEVIAQVKGLEDDPFVKGEAAMKIIASNQYADVTNLSKANTEMVMFPGASNQYKPQMYSASTQFAIAKTSKVGEEAAKFISFFVNDSEANKILNAERGIPVNDKIREELTKIQTPENKVTFDFVDMVIQKGTANYFVNPTFASQVSKAGQDAEEKAVYKKMSPAEAAEDFMKNAADIIAQN